MLSCFSHFLRFSIEPPIHGLHAHEELDNYTLPAYVRIEGSFAYVGRGYEKGSRFPIGYPKLYIFGVFAELTLA